jgi:fructose-1,6-bisphosphatase/inositol monophosphatase family enzyme
VVTNCDIASENAIVGFLARKFQNAKIISEEVGEIMGDEEFVFIVDPLDGLEEKAGAGRHSCGAQSY